MLKLETTLIATTAARPRQGGWSAHRGVDFIASDPNRRTVVAILAEPAPAVAAERPCFLGEDNIPSPMTALVRRHVTEAAEASAPDNADTPLTRAWLSVARKVAGS